jgi:hypothetical protein
MAHTESPISFWPTPEQRRTLREFARARGLTQSDAIREAIAIAAAKPTDLISKTTLRQRINEICAA